MAVSIEFKERLNDLIAENDFKRSAARSEMNIDYRSLSNALNYGILPTPRLTMRIADYFNVSIKYLLGKTDDEYFVKLVPPATFTSRLEQLCRRDGITYYRLSAECHISTGYIARWRTKGFIPSWEMLELLCNHFKVSLDYLLGRTDDIY